jgi:excisionase family DNA binding protein
MEVVLEPKWFTIKQVAELLGFSVSKTKMLIAERQIKSVKVGRCRRILPKWVDEYVEQKAMEVEEYDWTRTG